MLQKLPNQIELLHSTDLDETRGLVARIFCDHHLQVDGAQQGLDYVHRHARASAISFSQMQYGAAVHIAPQTLDDFFLIQVPLTGVDQIDCGKLAVQSHTDLGTIHSPGESFRMNWSPDCSKLAIRIEREALERQASSLLGGPLREPLRFRNDLHLDTPHARFWRQTVREAMRGLQQGEHPLLHPLMRDSFEQLIITGLLAWQPSSISDLLAEPPHPDVLPRHVKQAEDYMRAHLGGIVTNEILAEITGVSIRTLQAGFQKFRGVSPMRYLRDLRMAKVREELLDPGKPRSVTTVATQWGFFELGRFSAEYRKCYGELPSSTLRRAA